MTKSAKWTVRKVADYWRLQRNGYLVATFNSKGAALAGMETEKRRERIRNRLQSSGLYT